MTKSKVSLGILIVYFSTSCIFCSDNFFEFSSEEKNIFIDQEEGSRFLMLSNLGDTLEYRLIRRFDGFISTGAPTSTCRDEQETLEFEYLAFPFRKDSINVSNFVTFRVSSKEGSSNLRIFFPYSNKDNTEVFEVDIEANQLLPGVYDNISIDILDDQMITPTVIDDLIRVQQLSNGNVTRELVWTRNLGWIYFKDLTLDIEKNRLF